MTAEDLLRAGFLPASYKAVALNSDHELKLSVKYDTLRAPFFPAWVAATLYDYPEEDWLRALRQVQSDPSEQVLVLSSFLLQGCAGESAEAVKACLAGSRKKMLC